MPIAIAVGAPISDVIGLLNLLLASECSHCEGLKVSHDIVLQFPERRMRVDCNSRGGDALTRGVEIRYCLLESLF